MERFHPTQGRTISYERAGNGPPLVLVHGAFSDHRTNWEFVMPALSERFTVYAIARRGRGETTATEWHGIEDEAADLVALLERIGEPVLLLGHSYGAHCALAATDLAPERVRRLVLYEPPHTDLLTPDALAHLEALAAAGRWDDLAFSFFRDTLLGPEADLEALRQSELWPPIVKDAPASLGDLRALTRHTVDLERCRRLEMPILLQTGTESPGQLYLTDALAAVLPNARIGRLAGQAHEGMTTAPQLYLESLLPFLTGDSVAAATG